MDAQNKAGDNRYFFRLTMNIITVIPDREYTEWFNKYAYLHFSLIMNLLKFYILEFFMNLIQNLNE